MSSSYVFGDAWNLREIRNSLKSLAKSNGRALAIDVAKKLAPKLTSLMQEAYDSGQTIFDESRPLGERGNKLSLVDSGTVRGALRWSQAGTIVRAALNTPYARFLIGKYKIMPSGAQELPFRWQDVLLETANDEIARLAPETQY